MMMNEKPIINGEVQEYSSSNLNNETTSLKKNNTNNILNDYTNVKTKLEENNTNNGYNSSSEKNITIPNNNNMEISYSTQKQVVNEENNNIDNNNEDEDENKENLGIRKGKARRPSIFSRLKKTTRIITKCLNFNLPPEVVTSSSNSNSMNIEKLNHPQPQHHSHHERRYSVAPTVSSHHFSYSQTTTTITNENNTITKKKENTITNDANNNNNSINSSFLSTISSSSSSSSSTTTVISTSPKKLLPLSPVDSNSIPDFSLQSSTTTTTTTTSPTSITSVTSNTSSFISCSSNKKLTIVIDLDETLIHSKFPQYQEISDFTPFSFQFNMIHKLHNGHKEKKVCVWMREGLESFLNEVAEFANVIIFTASVSEYAKPLIDILDPKNKLIAGRLYRESLSAREGKSEHRVKDLSKILLENNQNLDLSKTVIIDNTPTNFVQFANAVLVPSFFPQKIENSPNKPQDKTLAYLSHLLKRLSEEDDVREYLAELRSIKQRAIEVRRNSEPVIQSMLPSRIQI